MRFILTDFKILFILVFFYTGCSEKEKGHCSTDRDCRHDRICESGKCVSYIKNTQKKIDSVKKDKSSGNAVSKPIPKFSSPVTPPVIVPPAGNKNPFGNLNLNFDLNLGSGNTKFKMKGIKNGKPDIEVCSKGQCSDLDFSDPASLQKMVGIIAGTSPNDPMSKMMMDMMKHMGKKLPSNHLKNRFNPRGSGNIIKPNTGGNTTIKTNPVSPQISGNGPLKSIREIVSGRHLSIGREAVLSGMTPVIISLPASVTFRAPKGKRVETSVAIKDKKILTQLAKTDSKVIIRIKIKRITDKVIYGELLEIAFP
ncbi:MAG: hypothetical protein JXR95_10590 [Deltaproteobacteria bacterium]|nr:hypothetical protein [Deltaproteobacteria bacterium]